MYQKMLAIGVEATVGVVGELVGLAAVNVVPPVADQSDLVKELHGKQIMTNEEAFKKWLRQNQWLKKSWNEFVMTYSHVGAEIAGEVSVNVAPVKHLALSGSTVGIESLLGAAVDATGLGDLRQDGEVDSGHRFAVEILNLIDGQLLSTEFVQGIPDFGVLVTVDRAAVGHTQHGGEHKKALHFDFLSVEERNDQKV